MKRNRVLFSALNLLAAILPLLWVSATSAQETSAEFELQDAREWVDAMNFVEGRGLDINEGVESRTGLWSLVIEEGEGPLATRSDTVTAHATGWLADGTKFWSSHDGAGQPMTNSVSGFVKGFTEGLTTMKAGGKSIFVFPGKLGYGPRGNPGANIHPNATLVFEVELVSIQ